MEGNFQKPLLKDLNKQKWYSLLKGEPVSSEGKEYEYADGPLLIIVFLEILAAFLFIFFYIPDLSSLEHGIIRLILFIAIWVYPSLFRLFVYRYARFRTAPDRNSAQTDEEKERWDELGEMLKADKERKAARKSRCAFLALFAAVAAIAALFYVFAWGMAEQRVNSSPLLAEFARIAEKQGDAIVDVDSDGVEVWSPDGETPKDIAREDEAELKRIFGELQWNYVESLEWDNGRVRVSMDGGFESKSSDVYFGKQ